MTVITQEPFSIEGYLLRAEIFQIQCKIFYIKSIEHM